jgi:hypothetical protein
MMQLLRKVGFHLHTDMSEGFMSSNSLSVHPNCIQSKYYFQLSSRRYSYL